MESVILESLSFLGIGPDNRSRRADHSVPFHMVAGAKSEPRLRADGSAPNAIAQHLPLIPSTTDSSAKKTSAIERDEHAAMLAAALDDFDVDSNTPCWSVTAATGGDSVQTCPQSIVPSCSPESTQQFSCRSEQRSVLGPERVGTYSSAIQAACIAHGTAECLGQTSLLQRLLLSARLSLSVQGHWTAVTGLDHAGDLYQDEDMPSLLRERQPVPACGMIDEAANTAPLVPSSGSITDGNYKPELDACSAVLTTSNTVKATGPQPVQSAQQWPVRRGASYEPVVSVRRSSTDRSFQSSSVIRIQSCIRGWQSRLAGEHRQWPAAQPFTSEILHIQACTRKWLARLTTEHGQRKSCKPAASLDQQPDWYQPYGHGQVLEHVVSAHLVTMHVLAMCDMPPCEAVGVPISQHTVTPCTESLITASPSGQGGLHDWPGDGITPSEQGGAQQLLLPYPQAMLLHGTDSPTLGLTMPTSELALTGQGMQAVKGFAPQQQLTSRVFVLSLRGAGWKRPYPQEQYMAPHRTQPPNYYDMWNLAEDESFKERYRAGIATHASSTPAVLPRCAPLSYEEQQQVLSQVLTGISKWGTVEWTSWQTASIRCAAQAALVAAMRKNQFITGGQLKKAIKDEAAKKASFLNQARQKEELKAQRRTLPDESELSTVLADAKLPTDGPGGMIAAQVHAQNEAAREQHESALLDRVIAQRISTFPAAYRLYRGRHAGLVLTKSPSTGLTNYPVREKEIKYLTDNGVLPNWAKRHIDEIITGLKQQLANGDSD